MGQDDMTEHLQFTLDLADTILVSADNDSRAAFTKAIGTLAQIIHITVQDDYREEMLIKAADMLHDYLNLLDDITVSSPSKLSS